MAHPATIAFMTKDNVIVDFRSDLMSYCAFLSMIVRRSKGTGPIKINSSAHDIRLTEAICQIGLYPCPYQTKIQPHDFDTSFELGEFMGIEGVNINDDVDWGNEYIDDFLFHLGLEADDEDAPPDLTPAERDECAKAALKELEKEMLRELESDEEEDPVYWSPFY